MFRACRDCKEATKGMWASAVLSRLGSKQEVTLNVLKECVSFQSLAFSAELKAIIWLPQAS